MGGHLFIRFLVGPGGYSQRHQVPHPAPDGGALSTEAVLSAHDAHESCISTFIDVLD